MVAANLVREERGALMDQARRAPRARPAPPRRSPERHPPINALYQSVDLVIKPYLKSTLPYLTLPYLSYL